MSEQQQQDLTPTIQELMVQMARMQAELDNLKGHPYARSHSLPQPVAQPKPKVTVSTTRRTLLRQLVGGLVAGLAVAGIGNANPNDAEAKLSSNPTDNGLTGRVGMLVMPPGGQVGNTTLGGSPYKVGLLVSGDNAFSLTDIVPTVNSAIIAKTAGGGSTIVGLAQDGVAIYGNTINNNAVWGISTSSNGVRGESTSGNGVFGYTAYNGINLAAGVYGKGLNTGIYGEGAVIGVFGKSDTNYSHMGVRGEGYTGIYGDGSMYGIYGICDQFGQAGHFEGDVHVNGTLVKTAGSFKIDHPLNPENKYLYHSFVESPDMKNIYDGVITLDNQGEAIVEMPEWFEALNSDFRYQLTSIGASMPDLFIAEEMKERKFKIAGGKAGQRVSWLVTGIRQDEWARAHRIPIEEDKADKEKGKYLHPELFGQPKEMSVHPRPEVGPK